MTLTLLLGFQIILPEGGDITQSLDDWGEMLDDVIHLLFCIINGKAEADRSVGGRKWNAHCPEHMRRLQ